MDWLTSEAVSGFLNAAMASQVTQFGVAFSIAAFIHAGRVKKEIASQAGQITGSIDNLASALRQDLANQSERIGKVENRVAKIEDKTK